MRDSAHNDTTPTTAVKSNTAPNATLSCAPTDSRFSALRAPTRARFMAEASAARLDLLLVADVGQADGLAGRIADRVVARVEHGAQHVDHAAVLVALGHGFIGRIAGQLGADAALAFGREHVGADAHELVTVLHEHGGAGVVRLAQGVDHVE